MQTLQTFEKSPVTVHPVNAGIYKAISVVFFCRNLHKYDYDDC